MSRAPEEFRLAATLRNIQEWYIRGCSMCDYPLSYYFFTQFGDVAFDSGCDCVSYKNIQPKDWNDVARQYNIQTDEKIIEKYDAFWGFTKE